MVQEDFREVQTGQALCLEGFNVIAVEGDTEELAGEVVSESDSKVVPGARQRKGAYEVDAD